MVRIAHVEYPEFKLFWNINNKMVLLVYHFDKNENDEEFFEDQEVRLDLGFFPKQNTKIRFKSIGWNNNSRGGEVFVQFPDVLPDQIYEEEIDLEDRREVQGMMFSANEGVPLKEIDTLKAPGRFGKQSDNRIVELELGYMDTQKDYFTLIVNARRGVDPDYDEGLDRSNNLNNISVILEMIHDSQYN